MPITVTTDYSKDTVSRFVSFNTFRKKGLLIMIFLLWLAALGVSAFPLISGSFNLISTFVLILLVVLGIAGAVWLLVFPQRDVDKNKKLCSVRNTYIFADDKFMVTVRLNENEQTTQYAYSDIEAVYETVEFMYIYLESSEPYIIDKNFASQKDIDGIKALLKNKAFDKKLKFKK